MLTKDEKNYLKNISKTKKVRIFAYNQKAEKIANVIIKKINKSIPELKVQHIGAQALKIAGQKDIDISIFCSPENFGKYLQKLMKLFDIPIFMGKKFIEWNFIEEGYSVELYLTDPKSESTQRQLKVFEILKNSKKLLQEYDKLKQSYNEKLYRDYQKAKYEFYNKILNL